MSTDSFSEFAEHLARGDATAVDPIYARFAHRLVALARSRLSSQVQQRVDADDVTQSVFRSFFRRHRVAPYELDSWDSIWALLAQITVRKCHRENQFHRAQCRDVCRERSLAAKEDAQLARQIGHREPDPQEVLMFQELLGQLLQRVPEEKREWLVLRLQGYSVAEISQQCGRTERSVYRLLDRAQQYALEMQQAT